jgi:two-component system, sensor histidine kinase
MKSVFLNSSIKQKLFGVMIFVVCTALVINFLISMVFTTRNFVSLQEEELNSLSKIIVTISKPAILFGDQNSAQKMLDSLKIKKNLDQVVLRGKEGDIVASIGPHDAKPDVDNFEYTNKAICLETFCKLQAKIFHEGEVIGSLFIKGNLQTLNDQKKLFIQSFSFVFIISLTIAIILVALLQKVITVPIFSLSDLASQVSSLKDYSLRSSIVGNDEVGILSKTFNEMLEQIQERDHELVKANKAKSEFVANTSHEIRTPINNIIGFSEILEKNLERKEDLRYVELIKISADSLLGVINDILDFSKIEAGKLELSPYRIELISYLKNVMEPLKEQAKSKEVLLEINFDASLPELFIDPARISQVLVNLVNNAIKFTSEKGKIEVTLESRVLSNEEVVITISVKDNGVGITSEAKERIFEAFAQADASTSRNYGGTGLGLTISSHIVQLLGGSIYVETEINKGSTFKVEFIANIYFEELEENSTTGIIKVFNNPSRSNSENKKILVVDDNNFSREITAHRLHHFGYTVMTAIDGFDAIRIIEKDQFDIIFMDCQMPGLDGFETTKKIREIENRRNIRSVIIALTAHAIQGYREICLNAGMDDYLSKPIKEEELSKFITNYNN